MSGIQLLDKTRKIGKLLHNSHSSKVVFNDICKVMQKRKSTGHFRQGRRCNPGAFRL